MRLAFVGIAAVLALAALTGCLFPERDEPVPTETPDLAATILAAVALALPTDTPAPTNTPTPTPDLGATVQAMIAATVVAMPPTAAPPQPADTPRPTFPPRPTPPAPTSMTASRPAPAATFVLPRPVPTLVATATPVSTKPRFDGRAIEKEVHQLINSERVRHGLPGLDWVERIALIARAHSEDMGRSDYFSHDNQKGESPTDRAIAADYPCRKPLDGGSFSYGLAENIWRGWEFSSYTYELGSTRYNWMSQTQLARQAVSSWMGSPGHRQNILTSRYDKTGIGVGFGTANGEKYAVYLTQNFC